jgi:hypothetical protein
MTYEDSRPLQMPPRRSSNRACRECWIGLEAALSIDGCGLATLLVREENAVVDAL